MKDVGCCLIFFDESKDLKLRQERGIGFEDIIKLIETHGDYVVRQHPNPQKYPHQFIIECHVAGYMYVVPFVMQSGDRIFLKTIYPSRKATKQRRRNPR